MVTADIGEREQGPDAAEAPTLAFCSDCLSLMAERRFLKGPHPYLVSAGPLDEASCLHYRCLICRETLTYHRGTGRWMGGSAGAGPTEA